MKFTRITTDPKQMDGVPCIRGLRIPMATVFGMLADGMTEAEILAAYPDLEREDIAEALRYAADAVRNASSGSPWGEVPRGQRAFINMASRNARNSLAPDATPPTAAATAPTAAVRAIACQTHTEVRDPTT